MNVIGILKKESKASKCVILVMCVCTMWYISCVTVDNMSSQVWQSKVWNMTVTVIVQQGSDDGIWFKVELSWREKNIEMVHPSPKKGV